MQLIVEKKSKGKAAMFGWGSYKGKWELAPRRIGLFQSLIRGGDKSAPLHIRESQSSLLKISTGNNELSTSQARNSWYSIANFR